MKKFLNKIKIWLIDEYNLECIIGCVLLYPAITRFSHEVIPSFLFIIGIYLVLNSYKKYWFKKGRNHKENVNNAE